jgi:superfamily I DNA and/or RNA helicase
MHEFGDLITDILPCMLMSPESVARFFPAQADLFDIVVFDEASQVRVSDAVGAMGRARSVVVVGDSKQMPPTSFAESAIGAGDDEGDTLEFVRDEESILSECVQAQVPSKWLSWHYRSQDESLIAFSNRAYYRDRLSSFPAPHHGASTEAPTDSAGYGVSLRLVDGQFLRSGTGKKLRTNPVEAAAIVAEIVARFAADPEGVPSIGVITFNVQQRALIEGSLRDSGDDRIVHALESDGDGLFVKNLENVQGDERDTILFSTAFSADASGRLPLNFGPLNLPGGERRLNVAITRARRQVIVFSSFAPADLRAEETISAGVKDLRAYLDLAAGGSDGLASPLRQSGALDRHREEIAEALRERGFAVHTDVGLSDFRVDLSVATTGAPEHPVMAVLLDGPTWAARRTVSDRDGLPVEVLSRLMGWPAVERVWMPEWLADAGAVLDRLAEQLDALDAARQARESAALA